MSGNEYEYFELNSNGEEFSVRHSQPQLNCPLPLLKYKMFSNYKKLKENAHLRKALAAMWKSLGFGTKQKRYKDPACKPAWYDEEKFVPWDKFKGSARPEDFTGNWAYLQYDILKAAYMHYLTEPEIEQYLQTSVVHLPYNADHQVFPSSTGQVVTAHSSQFLSTQSAVSSEIVYVTEADVIGQVVICFISSYTRLIL